MKLRRIKALTALGLLATSSVALACGDPGCMGGFNLVGKDQSCQGRAMLAPGNDSRINLMFLLADRGGRGMAGFKPPRAGISYNDESSVFLDWRLLREALYPTSTAEPAYPGPPYAGTRCAGYAVASAALQAAMAANRKLSDYDRSELFKARGAAEQVCREGTSWERQHGDLRGQPVPVFAAWPSVTSSAGSEFKFYLAAADAFYGERWSKARDVFATVAEAKDPWVRESAAYMQIRVAFAAAQAAAFDEYGSYDHAKVDRAEVKRGLEALAAYLKAWPKGRYAASAQGLLRRGLWLAGSYDALGGAYAGLLERTSPGDEAAARLVEEIDTKLLFNAEAKGAGARGSLLLAAQTLAALRDTNYEDNALPKPGITAAQIDALAPQFSGQGELFAYLQATHAFYYARDHRRVLALIPDDARRASHTNLSFSRQMLRGMALAALKDRNEAGFWQELIPGAKGLWQRPLAELGLALAWERSGGVAAVFAPQSPITDSSIRSQLINRSADADLLRAIVKTPANAPAERDQALYTLLARDLIYGQFAAFTADVKLPLAEAKSAAGVFTAGRVTDVYPCAPLAVTVAALAKNPSDVPGRLCLGDFYRLHGVDVAGGRWDNPPRADELGGAVRGFAGKQLHRGDFYTAIIADPRARPDDKAYALYRAVMCYAPSRINECGNADVAVAQRKAWHDRLKRDYPTSLWAKQLRYYW